MSQRHAGTLQLVVNQSQNPKSLNDFVSSGLTENLSTYTKTSWQWLSSINYTELDFK